MFTVRIAKNQQQNKFTFKKELARQDAEYLPRLSLMNAKFLIKWLLFDLLSL